MSDSVWVELTREEVETVIYVLSGHIGTVRVEDKLRAALDQEPPSSLAQGTIDEGGTIGEEIDDLFAIQQVIRRLGLEPGREQLARRWLAEHGDQVGGWVNGQLVVDRKTIDGVAMSLWWVPVPDGEPATS